MDDFRIDYGEEFIELSECARKLNISKLKFCEHLRCYVDNDSYPADFIDFRVNLIDGVFIMYLEIFELKKILESMLGGYRNSILADKCIEYIMGSKERVIDLLIPMEIIKKNLGYTNREEFDEKIKSFPWGSFDTDDDEFVLHQKCYSTADIKGERAEGVPLYTCDSHINAKYLKKFLERFSGIPQDNETFYIKILRDFFEYLDKKEWNEENGRTMVGIRRSKKFIWN